MNTKQEDPVGFVGFVPVVVNVDKKELIMPKEQKEQLVKIFARTAQAYAALMMYYDNLADDRNEYADEEVSEQDAYDAATDLDNLDQFVRENTGYSIDEIIEQYGSEE